MTLSRITDNEVNDYHPDVWGAEVVWEGQTVVNREIFLRSGSTTIQRVLALRMSPNL
jgi:hypothetical protein